MTKYKAKHIWVKEAHLPKALAELADSATDHIGHILDNTGPRDLIYLTAYAAAVFTAYNLIAPTENAFRSFNLFIANIIPWIWSPSKYEIPVGIDQIALIKALIAAYMVLKIDASDITSAISKLGSLSVATIR